MKKIQTTVYRLPCAGFAEKDGTFVNSARWLQWKNAALPPPGQAPARSGHPRADLPEGARALSEGWRRRSPIRSSTSRWPYTQPEHPSLAEVAQRDQRPGARRHHRSATGQPIKAGQQLPGFAWLKDDGTTLCGNWLYCGSWTEAGNQMARRGTEDPSGLGIYPNWAWSWPANRRVHVQPRVLRSGGQAVGSRAAAGLVERGDGPLGRQRRARLQGRLEAVGSHGAVHHEPRGRRPHSSARSRRSPTDRSPSTTSRSRARSPIRCTRSSRTTRS